MELIFISIGFNTGLLCFKMPNKCSESTEYEAFRELNDAKKTT